MSIKENLENIFLNTALVEYKESRNRKSKMADINNISYIYLCVIYKELQTTVSKIASELQVSKPYVTNQINILVKKGLVHKIQSKLDKRVYFLEVDTEVKDYFDEGEVELNDLIQGIEKEFSKEKIEAFDEILEFINNNISLK
ncbi:MarR family transcriptional regulator [uncultured Clostridium sp.]|uniref:MarR family winged helix-turn-helix transcriptional regulator n=1 Tax=uncultured Clostridium sp. TaxID=59620 RepID=UPI0026297DD5|nr:MarR family transcriptional regulator [uncultured Clostridium sp.]